jgi:hypothetical protein
MSKEVVKYILLFVNYWKKDVYLPVSYETYF